MGNHTKENKNKKKQLKLDSAKTSFVAGNWTYREQVFNLKYGNNNIQY